MTVFPVATPLDEYCATGEAIASFVALLASPVATLLSVRRAAFEIVAAAVPS